MISEGKLIYLFQRIKVHKQFPRSMSLLEISIILINKCVSANYFSHYLIITILIYSLSSKKVSKNERQTTNYFKFKETLPLMVTSNRDTVMSIMVTFEGQRSFLLSCCCDKLQINCPPMFQVCVAPVTVWHSALRKNIEH